MILQLTEKPSKPLKFRDYGAEIYRLHLRIERRSLD